MQTIVAPSMLSADFGNLERDLDMINTSNADWLHVDIMDGVFVPNISFGFPVLKYVQKLCTKPLDVHLMIVEPAKFINEFKEHGAQTLTIHYEACTHLHRTLQEIRALGMKAGVSLNPHTPVHLLEEILEEADMVLIMSVNPGFGGQSFIENSLRKISRLKDMIIQKNYKTLIEVDGGVNEKNAKKLIEAGTDVLVAGNAVFKAENPHEAINKLKQQK